MQSPRPSTFSFLTVLMVLLFAFGAESQQCRNSRNWRVDWWVMLSFPNSVSTGYTYFDSRFAAPSLVVELEEPDAEGSPLRRTLAQIQTYNMSVAAWNDQPPNGSESSVRAHSKSISAFDFKSGGGFQLIHSMPEWPKLLSNGSIDPKIDPSQQKFGQHIMCISANKQYLIEIINKIIPIRPFEYVLNYDCPTLLGDILSLGLAAPNYADEFSFMNYTRNGSELRMIFKNGYLNSSIFEDGLTNLLQSDLVAQTWGRPLQAPVCGGAGAGSSSQWSTGNILQIEVAQNITWRTTQDHSKWLVATNTDYACFGDMNRMESQWKRGGAFYCIKSQNLASALRAIVKEQDICQQQ